MQYTILINQAKSHEWGLNAQQAMLFAFLFTVPVWAKAHQVGDDTFFSISKAKVCEEMPLLSDKPDTIYRMMKDLDSLGVIELSSTPRITLIRITDKGLEWSGNRSEKNPTQVGKKSDLRSEKNPTNHITSNHITNDIGEKPKNRFSPPSLKEIQAYCLARGNDVDPQRFHDFYASKGWLVGKAKMKDWQAAVRTWEKSSTPKPTPSSEMPIWN